MAEYKGIPPTSVHVDTSEIDAATEKAERLKTILLECKDLIAELYPPKVAVTIE